MRTILVMAGGRESDKTVFDTALSAARPLGAHLEFLHVRISASDAAAYTPHVDFARGAVLREALGNLQKETKARSTAALRHFEELCEKESIDIAVSPGTPGARAVSASCARSMTMPSPG